MESWRFRSTYSLDECEWSVSWLSCFTFGGKSPSCGLCEPRSHCGRQGQEKNVCLSRQLNPDSLSSYPADTDRTRGEDLHVKFEDPRCFLASISWMYASMRSLVTSGSYLLRCSLIVPCWKSQWVSEIMFLTFRQQFVMLFCCVLTIETAATDRSLLH
jgi:hypothetical protein